MYGFRMCGSKNCVIVRALEILPVAIHPFLSSGTTESMQMPSIISKTLRKPAMTYQGSFDLPPVALWEWWET